MGSRTRSSQHTYGNIHDVDPLGYAKVGTSRTGTSYLWLSQGMTKTEVIFQPAAPGTGREVIHYLQLV